MARRILDIFYWLGVQLRLSSPGDFVVILVAEVIAILGSSLVARMFAREPRLITPKVTLWAQPPRLVEDGVKSYGVKSYVVLVSNEQGETAALSCEARITFEDIDKRDVLDLPDTKLTSSNFTRTIRTDLLWDDGSRQRTLRSGDDTEIEVLRLIPARNGVEAHFELPSCGDTWKSTVCLKLRTFYPKVRIVPLNGKHTTHKYELHQDSKRDWILHFDQSP